jgi:cytoskeletal protein RodZ
MRLLDRLNSPLAFAVVLVVFLAANGLLLYRYQANLETSGATSSASSEQSETTTGLTTLETTATEDTQDTEATSDSPPERPSLQRALEECDGEERECVLQFVSETAPEAVYVDEITGTDDSGRERNVVYFSDPDRGVCKIGRFEGQASDASPVYVAIVAGEGSYDDQYAECLPEF